MILRPLLHRFALLLAGTLLAQAAQAFDFDDVAHRAKALAAKPYDRPDADLPKALTDLSYEQYKQIQYKPERALWHGNKLPFEIQFYHPGLYFNQIVKLNLITAEGVRKIPFQPENFDYGSNNIDADKLRNLGFAGFRVHYPLNAKDVKDELIAFQGASYFRALGKNQVYGESARGLAIDTGELSGEEFPAFREFWIHWPRPEDRELTIYALLDSRRVTGAYRFQIRPGESTATEIKARLYFRGDVGKLGVAPLSSMFLFASHQPSANEDYRPEVHDSEGLSLQTDQEWIWRPLVNPKRLLITSFAATNPRGFGLMQRDRDFAHYEDLDARYDLRPSVWIAPKNDWGKGRVELVQIPTKDATNDNVVAYWVPEQNPTAGSQLDLEYSLFWQGRLETKPPLAWVAQTRRSRNADNSYRYIVDFQGGQLDYLKSDQKLLAGVWVADNGELLERQVVKNDATGGWRLILRVRRIDEAKPLEMRAVLRNGDDNISESWAYILPPEPR
ncbi:glucans biosynthesis protein [Solimonas aquatica]|uniref:Glucans biosynthesis protein G n=1 Tax=Solimonas aquatica TaxID=489703 RepID=A0A1H9JZQ8_9GAMM|nr:glucan biosynthesis protein G [Solimonas aquatica]SEQ92310.1 glucans biosynthesis protein [Solimonas aquatica]